MRPNRFFLSTFKGNYEMTGTKKPGSPLSASFLFHGRQQVDEIIEIVVEVYE